jgi:hypothetical protein
VPDGGCSTRCGAGPTGNGGNGNIGFCCGPNPGAGRGRFDVAAGDTATIRVEPTRAMRAALRKRHKVIARVTATLGGQNAPITRLITVRASR